MTVTVCTRRQCRSGRPSTTSRSTPTRWSGCRSGRLDRHVDHFLGQSRVRASAALSCRRASRGRKPSRFCPDTVGHVDVVLRQRRTAAEYVVRRLLDTSCTTCSGLAPSRERDGEPGRRRRVRVRQVTASLAVRRVKCGAAWRTGRRHGCRRRTPSSRMLRAAQRPAVRRRAAPSHDVGIRLGLIRPLLAEPFMTTQSAAYVSGALLILSRSLHTR